MTGKLQNTRVYALELVLLPEVSHLSDHTANDVVNTYFCARSGNISTENILLVLSADTHPLCSLLSDTWAGTRYTSLPMEIQSVHSKEKLCRDIHEAISAYRFPSHRPKAAPPTAIPATTSPVSRYHAFSTCGIQSMKGRLNIVNESDTMSPVAGASGGARLGRTTRYIAPNVLLIAPSARTIRLQAPSSCSLLTKRHMLPNDDR